MGEQARARAIAGSLGALSSGLLVALLLLGVSATGRPFPGSPLAGAGTGSVRAPGLAAVAPPASAASTAGAAGHAGRQTPVSPRSSRPNARRHHATPGRAQGTGPAVGAGTHVDVGPARVTASASAGIAAILSRSHGKPNRVATSK